MTSTYNPLRLAFAQLTTPEAFRWYGAQAKATAALVNTIALRSIAIVQPLLKPISAIPEQTEAMKVSETVAQPEQNAKETPTNIRLFDSANSGLSGAILGLDASEKVQQIFNSYLSCGMPIIKISSKGRASSCDDCNDLIREFVLSENAPQEEVDVFISEIETHINQTVHHFERSLVCCDDFILLQRHERLAVFISRMMSTGRICGLSVLVGSSDPDALNQLNSKFRDEILKNLWFVLTINEEKRVTINQEGTIHACDFEHVNFIAEWGNDGAVATVELE